MGARNTEESGNYLEGLHRGGGEDCALTLHAHAAGPGRRGATAAAARRSDGGPQRTVIISPPPFLLQHTQTKTHTKKQHKTSSFSVLEGLDVVYKLENLGTRSGRPTLKATVADSGELHVRRAAEAEWADEYGDD